MRRIESSDRFFDLLDKIGNGKFVTIGYVTGAKLNLPKVKRLNPQTKRMNSYDDYSSFGENVGAIVRITSYNMQYCNRDSVDKQYAKYKEDFNKIRAEYGLDPVKDGNSYSKKSNWSKNGPSLYSGNNEKLFGNSYNPQNTYKAVKKSTTYAIGENGHIIREIPKSQIIPFIKEKSPLSGVKALREMGVEEAKIEEYIKKESELHMAYRNFESKCILWMVSAINGEKFIYINDKLMTSVNGINIAPEDFIKIANERYQQDLNNIQEMENKMKKNGIIRIDESTIRRMIKERANAILSEMKRKNLNEGLNNQNYSHFAVSKKSGKIMNGWDYSEYDPSELRQFKKDYFDVDMEDYGFNPKDFRILTYKYLVRNGIDPNDDSNWANNDEANAEFVG